MHLALLCRRRDLTPTWTPKSGYLAENRQGNLLQRLKRKLSCTRLHRRESHIAGINRRYAGDLAIVVCHVTVFLTLSRMQHNPEPFPEPAQLQHGVP